MDNLYLLPSYMDFANYPTFLDITYGLSDFSDENYIEVTQKKISHLKNLLHPLKDKYEYIFIDVPPTKSYYRFRKNCRRLHFNRSPNARIKFKRGYYIQDLKNLVRDYNASLKCVVFFQYLG